MLFFKVSHTRQLQKTLSGRLIAVKCWRGGRVGKCLYKRVSILNVCMYVYIHILILTHPIGNVVRRADGVVVGSHVDGVPGRGRLGGPPRHMRRRRVRTGPKTLHKTKCNDCSRSHMYIPALSRPS